MLIDTIVDVAPDEAMPGVTRIATLCGTVRVLEDVPTIRRLIGSHPQVERLADACG